MKSKDSAGSAGVAATRAEHADVSRSDVSRSQLSRSQVTRSQVSGSDGRPSDGALSSLASSSLAGSSLAGPKVATSKVASSQVALSDVAGADVDVDVDVDAARPTKAAPARGANVDWRAVLAGASPREVLARLVNADVFELRARVARALAERCYLLDGDFVYLRCIARVARFATRYRGEPSLDVWLTEQVDAALLDALERADARGAACASEVAAGGDALRTQNLRTENPRTEDLRSDHLRSDLGRSELASGAGASGAAERAAGRGTPPKSNLALARNTPAPVVPTFVDLARPLGLDPERMRDVCSAFNHCAALERAAFFGLVLERGELESVAARLGVAPAECARAARHALERCMERATAGPVQEPSSRAPKGAGEPARSSCALGAPEGAADSQVRESELDLGRELARESALGSDEGAPGRASRTSGGATPSELRGPASARAGARTVVGESAEIRARSGGALASIRSAAERGGAHVAPQRSRGADPRPNAGNERGGVR